MTVRSLKKASLKGKRVLVRLDLDVPMEGGDIADDFRIREALPTLKFILRNSGRIRIISHLGRPEGRVRPSLSMEALSRRLEKMLGRKIIFIKDPFSRDALRRFNDADEILFFENIRFWPGEERNNSKFAARLALWGDCFINDAFAVSHRAHASVVALPRLLPAYAGLHLEEEIKNLSYIADAPRRPFVAVLGGAKLETKLPLIVRFLTRADRVLVGGALANSILSWRGLGVGKSRVELPKKHGTAVLLKKKNLYIPSDVVTTTTRPRPCHFRSYRVRAVGEVRRNEYIVDIGPKSLRRFTALIRDAATVLWNGPLGIAEIPRFSRSTKRLARSIIRSRAFSVVGGGDTIAALTRLGLIKGFDYVSTAGGAMLEFLSGNKLPAIEALKNNHEIRRRKPL